VAAPANILAASAAAAPLPAAKPRTAASATAMPTAAAAAAPAASELFTPAAPLKTRLLLTLQKLPFGLQQRDQPNFFYFFIYYFFGFLLPVNYIAEENPDYVTRQLLFFFSQEK
jgi:hypothetical protein